MYKFMTKNGQTIAFLVGLAIAVIFFISIFSGLEEFNMLDKEARGKSNLFNFGLVAARWLIYICFAGMIFFILFNVVTNIKGNLKLIIGLVLMTAIFFIMFGGATFEAPGTLLGDLLVKNEISPGANGFIVGGLWTAVVLFILAWASFIILEILNFFK